MVNSVFCSAWFACLAQATLSRPPHEPGLESGFFCCLWVLVYRHPFHIFHMQAALATPLGTIVDRPSTGSGDSMILVAVLLCTLLRGVRMQENKIAAITLLTHAAKYCDDDTRLQRIVPYLLVSLLESKAICPSSSPIFVHGLTAVLCSWPVYSAVSLHAQLDALEVCLYHGT